MKLLLDTCTFLWLITDAPELSPAARAREIDPGNEVSQRRVGVGDRG